MSDSVIIALFGTFLGGFQAYMLYLTNKNHRKTTNDIEIVRNDVNSKMTQLLKVTGESEKAKGKLEGIQEGKGL